MRFEPVVRTSPARDCKDGALTITFFNFGKWAYAVRGRTESGQHGFAILNREPHWLVAEALAHDTVLELPDAVISPCVDQVQMVAPRPTEGALVCTADGPHMAIIRNGSYCYLNLETGIIPSKGPGAIGLWCPKWTISVPRPEGHQELLQFPFK